MKNNKLTNEELEIILETNEEHKIVLSQSIIFFIEIYFAFWYALTQMF